MGRRNRGPRGNRNRQEYCPAKTMIRQVWASNFDFEISQLDRCLHDYTILSIDTEFPGFLRSCPWGSHDDQVYEDLRFNVTQTKMIQLGLTASDDRGIVGGTWEFNFKFDAEFDAHDPSSISFLKQNGLDFDKLKRDGISAGVFGPNLAHVLRKNNIGRWITFHGLYDVGYVMREMLEGGLPASREEFERLVVMNMGHLRDLKHIARFCQGLEGGRLGLDRLGELLQEKRFGNKHNAGSDSLLTASLHWNMMLRFQPDRQICDGFLYGLSTHFTKVAAAVYGDIIYDNIA